MKHFDIRKEKVSFPKKLSTHLKHSLVVATETRNLMVRTPLYNKPSL